MIVGKMNADQTKINTLRERLRTLEAQFDREIRARGFDPAQAENVALPADLAALYGEREEMRSELEELTRGKTDD